MRSTLFCYKLHFYGIDRVVAKPYYTHDGLEGSCLTSLALAVGVQFMTTMGVRINYLFEAPPASTLFDTL